MSETFKRTLFILGAGLLLLFLTDTRNRVAPLLVGVDHVALEVRRISGLRASLLSTIQHSFVFRLLSAALKYLLSKVGNDEQGEALAIIPLQLNHQQWQSVLELGSQDRSQF